MAPKRTKKQASEPVETPASEEPAEEIPEPPRPARKGRGFTVPTPKAVELPKPVQRTEDDEEFRDGSDGQDEMDQAEDDEYVNSASDGSSAAGRGRRSTRSGSFGSDNSDKDGGREHDRYLPIANVARIIKSVLPDNAKTAKDARDAIQECASEFISFVTSEGWQLLSSVD